MNFTEFLVEYERYKVICNGNAPEICERGDIKYSNYRAAINGMLRDPDKLLKIMESIRVFVDEAIATSQRYPKAA